MGAESKGRAWFGKIYNKLETILVEVDTFTSQNTLCLKSSEFPGWESVRSEPKEVADETYSGSSNVQQHRDRVDSPSCESPSDPPSHQNFDIVGSVPVEERVQGDILKENLSVSSLPDEERLYTSPLLGEYCDANHKSVISLGDEEPITTDEEYQKSTSTSLEEYSDANLPSATSLGDKEQIVTYEESQISTYSLFEDYCDAYLPSATNPTDEKPIITNEESQITNIFTPQKFSAGNPSVSSGEESFGKVEYNDDPVLAALRISTDDSNPNPLDIKTPKVPIQDNVANIRASNEDGMINGKYDVDDSALYALRDRTQKLRSFKRKFLDALTSKRLREKEYEQLAIWFGDANMASDLATKEDSKQVEAMDSESSNVLDLEDSQWELL